MCVALFAGASSAWAGVGFSLVPTVDQNVAVGDKGVQSSLVFRNASIDGSGETGYSNDSMRIDTITVVPSCGSTAIGGTCPVGSLDPGVLVPNPLLGGGKGAAGSACQGRTFDIALIDATMGQYSMTIVGAALILGPESGTSAVNRCAINYTVDVAKLPTIDSEGGNPGLQTGQKGAVTGTDLGGGGTPSNINKTGGGVGTAGTTVLASPTITTNASANVVLGAGGLSDQATITNLVQPVAGAGTVIFRLFGPDVEACTTAIYTSPAQPVTLSGSTGTAQSPTYTPTATGVYHWQAFYSGDAYNDAVNGLCNEASEVTTVTPVAVVTPPAPAPPPPPPATAVLSESCTTPPGPAPAGRKLCVRGTAAIAGHTGCQGTPFRVSVSGRQIERVVFTLDGKRVKTLNKANRGSLWVLPITPRALRTGLHRVLARTTFRRQSGTKARTLRVTFSRCSRRAASPAFTG